MLIKLRLTEADWQQAIKDVNAVEARYEFEAAILEERLEVFTQTILADKALTAAQKNNIITRLQDKLGYIKLDNTERLLLENNQTTALTKRYLHKNLHELTQSILVLTPTGEFIDLEAYRELKRRAQHSARAEFNLTLIKIQYKLSDQVNWEERAMLKLKALPAWEHIYEFSPEQRMIRARIYLHLGMLCLQLYHNKQNTKQEDWSVYCLDAMNYFYFARENGDPTTEETAQNYLHDLQQPLRWYGFEREHYQERSIKLQAILYLLLTVLALAGFASIFIASHALWTPVLARFGLFLLNGLGTAGLPLIASLVSSLAAVCFSATLYLSLKTRLPKRSLLFFKRQLRNFVRFFIPADFVKSKIELLNQQLAEIQTLLAGQEGESAALTRANAQLSQQLKALTTSQAQGVKSSHVDKVQAAANVSTRERELTAALGQAKAAEQAAKQALATIQTEISKAQEEIANVQSQIKQVQAAEQTAKAAAFSLQQQLQELTQQLTASQQQLQAVVSDNTALKQQLAELKSAQELLIQEKVDALQQVQAAERHHAQTQQQLAKLQLREEEHKQQINHLEEVLHKQHQIHHPEVVKSGHKAEQEQQDYKKEFKQAINKLSIETAYFEAAQQRALAAEQSVAQLTAEIGRFEQQLADLQGLVHDKEQRITELEQSLSQAHRHEHQLVLALQQKLANPYTHSHAFPSSFFAGLAGHNPSLPSATGSTPPASPSQQR